MARRDKYHINYEKLYPGIEIPPEVLSVLRKGDRKEEYQEVDLKQERFVYDPETKTAYFIPGREDSYERLIEDLEEKTEADIIDVLTEVYSSWIDSAISNYNTDFYYQPREYICECYLEGEVCA